MKNKKDLDQIIAYVYGNQESITPEQVAKLERLQQCADLTRMHGSRLKVIPMMVKQFSKGGRAYSAKMAQADFEDTQELFGANTQTSKMFWFDIILGFMIETRNNAYVKRQYNVASAIEARMLTAVKDFIGDNEAYDLEKLQPPVLELGFFPEQLKVDLPENLEEQLQKIMQAKKRKDLMLDSEAQDIEPEEEELI